MEEGSGGTIPNELNVVEFAQAHARELAAMEQAVKASMGNNLVAQRVPRHMRRRAAAYDIRRLPRRLREQARKEIAKSGGTPKVPKCPSRKHRRRPGNLLKEYERRSRKNVWLETHIWHAKRFHMGALWGYKVPLHPNDKGARAAYRSVAHHCLLQDLSYLCCLELCGPQDAIEAGLSHLTSPATGSGFFSKAFIQGNREGHTMLYSKGQYPYGAVCDVNFLWKPVQQKTNKTHEGQKIRQLWMWIHPAAYDQVLQELQETFRMNKASLDNISENISLNMDTESSAVDVSKDSESRKGSKSQAVSGLTKIEANPSFTNGQVHLTSLKDSLCRFHLTGPQSQAVLTEGLSAAEVEGDGEQWWEEYYKHSPAAYRHKEQAEIWDQMKCLQSPGELPPHVVLGMTVRDPRLAIPNTRTSSTWNPDLACDIPDICEHAWSPNLSLSPIWDPKVRAEVKASKMTDQQINKLRAAKLVPGGQLELGAQESRVPVLLIQRPGMQHYRASCNLLGSAGFGTGWDLILPSGWAMGFWIALIYRKARAAGLKELRTTALEMGLPCFPSHYPDTPGGRQLEQSTYEELRGKYVRVPPAKRCNYTKLGVVAPFHHPWQELTTEWVQRWQERAGDVKKSQASDAFYVLRAKSVLKELQSMCCSKSQRSKSQEPVAAKVAKKSIDHSSVHVNTQSVELHRMLSHTPQCLVPVYVNMVLRGVPAQFSMICVPSCKDLEQFSKDTQYAGPMEPLHPQPRPKLSKQAKKAKGKQENAVTKLADIHLENIIGSSSREMIGYVTAGHFMLGSGQGAGIGFVAVQGLMQVLNNRDNSPHHTVVLVRANNSLQYRLAFLHVQTNM